MREINNCYGFAIQKELKSKPDYRTFINERLLDAIRKHIDDLLNVSGFDGIYTTPKDGVNICLNIIIEENESLYNPYEEELKMKISSVNVRELETYFISRMEDLRFNNPKDKATFKERLQILFKGTVSGGRFETREVLKHD